MRLEELQVKEGHRGGVVWKGSLSDLANIQNKGLPIDGLCAMDLRTLNPNGQALDFGKREDRVLATRMIREFKPTWTISSLPCTACSSWNNLNHSFMMQEDVDDRMQNGRLHPKFAMEVCKYQLDMGRHFAHEHPLGQAAGN